MCVWWWFHRTEDSGWQGRGKIAKYQLIWGIRWTSINWPHAFGNSSSTHCSTKGSKLNQKYNDIKLILVLRLFLCLLWSYFIFYRAFFFKRTFFWHSFCKCKLLLPESLNKNNFTAFIKVLYFLAKRMKPRHNIRRKHQK